MMKKLAFTTVAALAVAGLAVPAQAQAKAPNPGGGQAAIAAPDTALGTKWKTSADVVVTGAGDADGYHLYIAREKDAFAWKTLATLRAEAIDIGPWGGSVCVRAAATSRSTTPRWPRAALTVRTTVSPNALGSICASGTYIVAIMPSRGDV